MQVLTTARRPADRSRRQRATYSLSSGRGISGSIEVLYQFNTLESANTLCGGQVRRILKDHRSGVFPDDRVT